MNFIPSEYQVKIFDFITKGVGNAVINAKAGSGKTTTLVEAMKLIPSKEKVLFIAFNKAIEQELISRLIGYDNVTVKTYHSLGFNLLKTKFKNINFNVNEYKYTGYINYNYKSFLNGNFKLTKNEIRIYKDNLKFLVDFVRFNLAYSENEMNDLCKKYSINLVANEMEVIPNILKWGIENINEIDYTDMIWICVEKKIKHNLFKYDFIFIDEAQDTSIMQQVLFKNCYKRGCRFVAIGDNFQCINIFAGADQDAFNKLQNEPNTVLLDLPITYRCPKKIVNLIHSYNPNIDIVAKEDAIDGEINYNVNPYSPKDGDMVLCRNTAPLVSLYLKYINVNKKSYIKGRNIGTSFKSLLNQIPYENLAIDMKTDGVFPRLYEQLFNMINKQIEITGMNYQSVINSNNIMDFIDTIKSLESLSKDFLWKNQLIDRINDIFTDNDNKGICLSTIHKAKGLEADNVFILCPSLIPSKLINKEWERISERNLQYVAITRTKNSLNYISESLFPPDLFNDYNSIINFMENQRKLMNMALNTNYNLITPNNLTLQQQIEIDANQINSKNKPIISNKNKKIGANKMANFLK